MALQTTYLNLMTFEDVSAWCAANGGEHALQEALAHGVINTGAMRELCQRWLAAQAAERAASDARSAIAAAVASARASERSARYTMYSAVLSAVALLIAALTYLYKS